MIAVSQWLRIWVFSMEIPGSNAGKLFSNILHAPFLPDGDCSIRIFQPHDLQLFGFFLVTL